MEHRTRNERIRIWVTAEEKAAILAKMQSAGIINLSGFARTMLLEGKIYHADFTELKPLVRELGYLNRNLNQIAHAAQTCHDLHEQDYQDVQQTWRKAEDLINRYFYRIIRTDGKAYLDRQSKE